MKYSHAVLILLTFVTTIHALALPTAFETISQSSKDLFKRKGGGGGGGGGGHGSSGGSSSSGGSGGSKGGSSGSSSGSTSSSGSSSGSKGGSSTTSNTGGRTKSGSGTSASYGGYYGGGAAVPYRAGSNSPSGVAPYFLAGSALAFYPGIWLYGAWAYHYPNDYRYHNDSTNMNTTLPVDCVCAQYSECGCDSNNDTSYIDSIANNNTISRVANVNGTQTLVINGTLANGTTAAGAAGSLRQGLLQTSGWCVVVAGVVYAVWFM